jgi:hypothetical protein
MKIRKALLNQTLRIRIIHALKVAHAREATHALRVVHSLNVIQALKVIRTKIKGDKRKNLIAKAEFKLKILSNTKIQPQKEAINLESPRPNISFRKTLKTLTKIVNSQHKIIPLAQTLNYKYR